MGVLSAGGSRLVTRARGAIAAWRAASWAKKVLVAIGGIAAVGGGYGSWRAGRYYWGKTRATTAAIAAFPISQTHFSLRKVMDAYNSYSDLVPPKWRDRILKYLQAAESKTWIDIYKQGPPPQEFDRSIWPQVMVYQQTVAGPDTVAMQWSLRLMYNMDQIFLSSKTLTLHQELGGSDFRVFYQVVSEWMHTPGGDPGVRNEEACRERAKRWVDQWLLPAQTSGRISKKDMEAVMAWTHGHD